MSNRLGMDIGLVADRSSSGCGYRLEVYLVEPCIFVSVDGAINLPYFLHSVLANWALASSALVLCASPKEEVHSSLP